VRYVEPSDVTNCPFEEKDPKKEGVAKAPTVQYRILSIYGYFCICIGIGIGSLHIFEYTVNIQYLVNGIGIQLNLKGVGYL